MSLRTEELKNRVLAEQKRLESRLRELKADALGRTADERDRVKAKLEELRKAAKGSWDAMSDETMKKLNAWLDRS